jgi:3-hydroxyacyl-CoA dehydrogenase
MATALSPTAAGAFGTEMNLMVEEGALPEQVDKVMVDFDHPIGPFATADLSGLDIGYDSRQHRAAQDPNYRKMPIADIIIEMGRRGPEDRSRLVPLREGRPDPAPDRRASAEDQGEGGRGRHFRNGPSPMRRSFRRLLFASSTRPARFTKRARSTAPAIDVIWLNGFGFPRYRGGLI